MTLDRRRRPEPLDHAELARLLPAPGDPVLPQDRRLLLEDHLMREIQHHRNTPAAPAAARRSRRRLVCFAVSGALVALAGGAVAATTLMGGSPAAEPNSVRCYSAAVLTAEYSGTTMAAAAEGAPSTDIAATVSGAVNACAGLWEAALIQPGRLVAPTVEPGGPLTIPDATPGKGKVPPLTACVRDDGEAAVFPGKDRGLCQNLGLARLVDRP